MERFSDLNCTYFLTVFRLIIKYQNSGKPLQWEPIYSVWTNTGNYRQVERETDRQAGRQAGRERETDRQADRERERQTGR